MSYVNQCFGSRSSFDGLRIRIGFPNADPDPASGGLKRAKMKEKEAKRYIIMPKMYKRNEIG
jgi:hypothetical protein